MQNKFLKIISPLIISFLLLISCNNQRPEIVIGSKFFTEQKILAEIISVYLTEKTGIRVKKKIPYGDTFDLFSALRENKVDIYPEYSGTGLTILYEQKKSATGDIFDYLRDKYQENFGLTWLKPFGFSNSYVFLMDREKAKSMNIKNISDLKGSSLSLGMEPEFFKRQQDGFKGVSEAYGIEWKNARVLNSKTDVYRSLSQGNTDIIVAYSTDSEIKEYGLFMLEDNKNFFPPYDAAPLIRTGTLEQYPEIAEALNDLSMKINEQKMQELNYQVDFLNRTPNEVARSFLAKENLLGKKGRSLKALIKIAYSAEDPYLEKFSSFLSKFLNQESSPYNFEFISTGNPLKKLGINEVQLALLDSSAYFSIAEETAMRRDDLGALLSFYPEVFHVLVRDDINGVEELNNKTINTGLQGSATSLVSRMFFDAYNIPLSNIRQKANDREKALENLESSEIDAMLLMTFPGDPFIEKALKKGSVKILSLDKWMSKNRFYKYLFLKPYTIDNNLYQLDKPVQTFSSKVTLAGLLNDQEQAPGQIGKPMGAIFGKLEKESVDYILREIFNNKSAINSYFAENIKGTDKDELVSIPEIFLRIPREALLFYEKAELLSDSRIEELKSQNLPEQPSSYFDLSWRGIAGIFVNLFVSFILVVAIYELLRRRKKTEV